MNGFTKTIGLPYVLWRVMQTYDNVKSCLIHVPVDGDGIHRAVKFILFIIISWLKSSEGSLTVYAGFENIFAERVPNMLRTYMFGLKSFRLFFESYIILHNASLNDDIEAALMERFNRTLKSRLYRYIVIWIDKWKH